VEYVAELAGQKLILVALLFFGQLEQIPAGYELFKEDAQVEYVCACIMGKNSKNKTSIVRKY
jgi:hypothetical protein